MKSKVVSLTQAPAGHKRLLSKPLILVVDDEALIADTLSIILNRAGYSTLTAYSPMRALEMVKKSRPSLLITDISMPEMNGIALAMAALAIDPECCVLLISGHATNADLVDARNAGYHFTLLQKPVHPSVILRNVAQQLRSGRSCSPLHQASTGISLNSQSV